MRFKRLTKRMRNLVIVLVVVFGGLVAYNTIRSIMMASFFAHFQPPAVSISTVEAKLENWHPVLQTVGTFVAIQGVDINAQVAGIVREISFESGQQVKTGDPLLIIDDSVEQASLKNAEANLLLQRHNFQRQTNLIKTGSTSISDLDTARAELTKAIASMEQIKATIAQKHIVAPFDGKLGIRQVSLGEYITPGQTSIVTLQSLNPLYLQFYLPEQNLSLLHPGQRVHFFVEAQPGKVFDGKITAVNSKIDINTHNVLIQATVDNPVLTSGDFTFMPGVFAKIQVLLPEQKQKVVLPLTAVTYTLYGDSVYIVKKDKTVYRQFVKTGEKKGNQVVILSGVKAGDQVVSAGQMKLHNGTKVIINNDVKLPDTEEVGP